MIKLIVDSTSDITKEEAQKLGVQLIPMKVLFDEEEYVVGENLTTEEFYEKLSKCKNLPKTTQINAEEYINRIKPLLDNGNEVMVMCLSSELSGSFNSLRIASDELNSKNLIIFDTETVTFAYKALILEAVKLIQSGIGLQELNKELEILKSKVKLLAVIDNIKYLVKGGRLSKTKDAIAGALNIKPIVTIQNKKVEVVSKSIGLNMGLKYIANNCKNVDTSKTIIFGHSNDVLKLQKLEQLIKQTCNIESNEICSIGPVIGTHAGPGCVGIVYFEK